MTSRTKSIKGQLKTIGRLPKFLAVLGASSLVVPVFSYAASASTVAPAAKLSNIVRVLNDARQSTNADSFNVPRTNLASKIGPNGELRISPHYSAELRSSLRNPTPTTTTVATSTVANTPITTVAPTTTTVATSPTTTVAPVTSTAVSPSPTTAVTPPPTTAVVTPTTTTTVAPTTTTTVPPATTTVAASVGLITTGASRRECVVPDVVSSTTAGVQSAISGYESATNSTVTCIVTYNDGATTWSGWDAPWQTNPYYGYQPWVAQAPQTRQLVLSEDLLPTGMGNPSNPLPWEQACAAGDYNTYATTLAQNLIAAGFQNTVMRLGWEMNGPWENDFMGNTTQEQSLWATCFANEVTAMRSVAGGHFLFDWNPNACTENVPYANFYPGNAYVDIVGLDLYDQSCVTPNTPVSFTQLANLPASLTSFEAFASAQGKAMSIPEWGLVSGAGNDDPAYINGIGSAVNKGNFAFEAYFDAGADNIIQLGPSAPLSTAAFTQQFG